MATKTMTEKIKEIRVKLLRLAAESEQANLPGVARALSAAVDEVRKAETQGSAQGTLAT